MSVTTHKNNIKRNLKDEHELRYVHRLWTGQHLIIALNKKQIKYRKNCPK